MRKEDHREQMNLAMGLAQNMATLQHQHDKWAKQLAERHSSLRLMVRLDSTLETPES